MPWRETSVPDQRKAFMDCALNDSVTSLSGLCRQFGISRTTAYTWLARYDEADPASLCDQSKAPRSHPNATDKKTEETVVSLRRAHPSWGPRKVRASLLRTQPDTPWPCASTIGQLLKTNGLVESRKRRRAHPDVPGPALHKGAPNALWTVDFKGQFQTRDNAWCFPLTLLDHHSRYLLRLQSFTDVKTPPVKALMESAFREYGLPHSIRCDNGCPFGARGVGRLSTLSVWWIHLGITVCPSRPAHPEDNGAHERFHRTLLRDAATPPQSTRRKQQQAFTAYRDTYNNERPHEALLMRTPSDVYTPSPRPFPKTLPEIVYPDHARVRSVSSNGCLRFLHREFFLSETLAKERVGFFPVEKDRFVVCFGEVPLAVFDEHKKNWLQRSKAEPILRTFAALRTAP